MKRLSDNTADKLIHIILTEAQKTAKSRAELLAIAQRIYNAKAGVFGTDDEETVKTAFLEIKTNNEFSIMNALFKSIASNEDVRDYVAGFYGQYTDEFLGIGLSGTETSLRETTARLDVIIKHLKSIGVGADVLQKVYDKLKPYADQPDLLHGEFLEWWDQNDHLVFSIMETVGLFVPGLGWAFSLGVGIVDAAQYGIEGEYYEMGPAVIFSALPGLAKGAGAVGSKVAAKLAPAWEALGKQGATDLANKLITSSQTGATLNGLTRTQQAATRALVAVKDAIQPALNKTTELIAKRVAIGRLAQGKDVFINTGKIALSKGERIIYGLADNVFTGAEIGAKFYAWNKTGNFLEKDAWAPVYDKYIRKTEMENQINQGLDAALKDMKAGGTGINSKTSTSQDAAVQSVDLNQSQLKLPGDDGNMYHVWTYYKPKKMSFDLNGEMQQYKIQTDNNNREYWQLYNSENNPWSDETPVTGLDDVQSIFNQNVQPIRQENMKHKTKSSKIIETKIHNILEKIGMNSLSEKSKSTIKNHVMQLLEATCVVPFKNQTEGDEFRAWFIKRYPAQAKTFDLDPSGPYNNETIRKAFCWSSMGSDGATAGSLYTKSKTSGDIFSGSTFSDMEIYIIIGMLIAIGVGGYLTFRAARSGYRFIKALPALVKKKGAVDNVIDSIKNGTVLADLNKTIDKLNISEQEKAELKSQIREPGFGVQLEKELNLIMIEELKKGTISANDFINALNIDDPAIINKVNKIEQARTPKTTTTPKSSTGVISKGAGTVTGTVATGPSPKPSGTTPIHLQDVQLVGVPLGPVELIATSDLFALLGNVSWQQYQYNMLSKFLVDWQSKAGGSFADVGVMNIFEKLTNRLNHPRKNKNTSYRDNIWMLKDHVNAEYFPSYGTWKKDLQDLGIPLGVREFEEYQIQMCAWYLTKLR